jgi:hypothetical protein
MSQNAIPPISDGINVLGIKFEAFVHPVTNQAVFSKRGVAVGLKVARSTLDGVLNSTDFKALHSNYIQWPELLTTKSSTPISVVTQSDLACLVKILADKKNTDGSVRYPVPKSMQDAGFPIILQQSVDQALGFDRPLGQYLAAGATLRQQLEYKYSYTEMRNSTFKSGYGVTGLCKINKQVSGLAVPDADERRIKNKAWRKECSAEETVKITVGNTVHQKAVEASSGDKQILDKYLDLAAKRTTDIYNIMDTPFN